MISIEMWIAFILVAFALFVADLKWSAGKAHNIGVKEALKLCCVWVGAACLFGLLIYYMLGRTKMIEYFTGYIIEYSLSVDNMFVFIMIFSYFGIPKKYQPEVLTWGIIGAVVMRLVLIFAGVELINAFQWIEYVFGAVLIYSAYKMAFQTDEEMDPGKNPALRLLGKIMPIDRTVMDGRFFVRKGKWAATSLFATLIVIETSDIIFAVDSIPAVLGVSRDIFIVYTSNIFAVVGLRSLYFLLASVKDLFRFLKAGICVVLVFVGLKMLLAFWLHIPALVSLLVILGILALSIALSLFIKPSPAGKKD